MKIIDYKFKEVDNPKLAGIIESKARDAGIDAELWETGGEVFCKVDPADLLKFCKLLNGEKELSFDYIRAITGIDYIDYMEMVYCLYSFANNWSLTIKVKLSAEKPEVETLTSIYRGADWFERETWEMLGINFKGHPDLRPLLLVGDEDFHPLKKSFEIKWEKRKYKAPKVFE